MEDNIIRVGDLFTFRHPEYPTSSIVGKVMIAETINEKGIQPETRDLVARSYPKQYCTKVEYSMDIKIYKFEL